jgi:hypothetical protein
MPIWTVIADIRRIIELTAFVWHIAAASGAAVVAAAAHAKCITVCVGADVLFLATAGIPAIVIQKK